jgi:hypothetical protein
MWTVFKLTDGSLNKGNYGFAWAIDQINGHKVIEHGGAWQGFTTYIARYVDDKLTVVVLTNLDSGHSNPGKIAHHVAGFYNAALAPRDRKPIQDTDPKVTALLRAVIDRMAAGKSDPNDFTPEFRSDLFPEEIKSWEEYLQERGAIKSFELLESKAEGQQRNLTYRLTFAKSALDLTFSMTAENRIADLDSSED